MGRAQAAVLTRPHIAALIAVGGAVILVATAPFTSSAVAELPAECTAGSSLEGSVRCGGLDVASGVERAPLWAGRFLFTDDVGRYRTGWDIANDGGEPLATVPAHRVDVDFPNDPDGRRMAALVWRYGTATDDLVVAAVWSVLQHAAHDAVGSADPPQPTVDDAQAAALEAEADRLAAPWHLEIALDDALEDALEDARRSATVTLLAGTTPVAGQTVSVLVSGSDLPLTALTGADGTATVEVPILPGTATVVATTESPGPVEVFRVESSVAEFDGPLMVTAGEPVTLRAAATVEVTAVPADGAPTTDQAVQSPVPVTGGATAQVAVMATALVVAGVGLVGTIRRPSSS